MAGGVVDARGLLRAIPQNYPQDQGSIRFPRLLEFYFSFYFFFSDLKLSDTIVHESDKGPASALLNIWGYNPV